MFGPILNLWIDNENGRMPEEPVSHQVPPHLESVEWRFWCACGYHWKSTGDAILVGTRWAAPSQACVSCHAWVQGKGRAEPPA